MRVAADANIAKLIFVVVKRFVVLDRGGAPQGVVAHRLAQNTLS